VSLNTAIQGAFQKAGVLWYLSSQADERLENLKAEMREVSHNLRTEHGVSVDLWEECLLRPEALSGVIQAFVHPMSQNFRALAFLLATGAEIESLEFRYVKRRESLLAVTVVYKGVAKNFTSDNHWDFEMLRHVGTMKLGGKPLLHGYFGFRPSAA
jgi:hypothetical protein